MRPEAAAAGAREAPGSICRCPEDGPRRPLPPRGPDSNFLVDRLPFTLEEESCPWIWAGGEWVFRGGCAHRTRVSAARQPEPGGAQQTFGSKGAFGFQHPVRLYLPASKRQEYLQRSGEKVLASFPVQATIHFYNDESDGSDSEDEEQEEETLPCHPPCQELEGLEENSQGGKSRDWPLHQGWPSGGRGGLCGKGQLPHGDPPGDCECSSNK
ncbi:PREDICTED: protein ripply3 [Propithecus coquereli]|uniref:protein ripply3 n=1 Tax=Propithecus coquereli TaxID=379532 RepID=UPI00063FC96A|nr:PREDICTED: protein ripply3 [Propithecus coquereli]